MRAPLIRNLVGGIGLAVALVIAVAVPLGYFAQGYLHLSMQSVRFEAALDNMTQGLCLFDAKGNLIVHNRRFAVMFGVPGAGASATTLMAGTRAAGRMFGPPSVGKRPALGDDAYELPDGQIIQVSRQAIPSQGWVATFEDITERRRSREELSRMARHDALSGLPNRLMFREYMEQLLLSDRGGNVAVLYLDLDGFKGVNDGSAIRWATRCSALPRSGCATAPTKPTWSSGWAATSLWSSSRTRSSRPRP